MWWTLGAPRFVVVGIPDSSHDHPQEKRSSFAPSEASVRYDGIYRIEKCWRAKGKQEHLMCRYLFVRCDNEPAPWSTTGAPTMHVCRAAACC